jgi:hypothetical protein
MAGLSILSKPSIMQRASLPVNYVFIAGHVQAVYSLTSAGIVQAADRGQGCR